MAEGARRTLDATPFGVLKMKIGIDPAEDLARVRAVADAVRGRAVLQVDGNTGYDVAQAIPTLTAMEATGALGAIEQPVARLADMAELARRLATPIMADESIYGPADAIDVVRQRAASIALMKIAKHGGIGPVRRIGAIFESAGLQLSVALYYDLIAAAANTGKIVNIKKGQFLSPSEMKHVAAKAADCGNKKIILTERGSSFGYNNLVVDMRSIPIMQSFGYPVVFDATHSVQLPGGGGDRSAGQGEFAPILAKAALAAGANGVFIETGPHKHAIQGSFFLYAWEPAGNRVELANAGARLILAPDWEPVCWTEADRKKGQAWGLKTIPTFHTHGTPPVEE